MNHATCHYRRQDLLDAFLEILPADLRLDIQGHLENGCPSCVRHALAVLAELMDEPPDPGDDEAPEEGFPAPEGAAPDPYDLAIDRAFSRVREDLEPSR